MYRESGRQFQSSGGVESGTTSDFGGGNRILADKHGKSSHQSKPAATEANGIDKSLNISVNIDNSSSNPVVKPQESSETPTQYYTSGCGPDFGVAGSHAEKMAVLVSNRARRAEGGDEIVAAKVSLTSTIEHGAVAEVSTTAMVRRGQGWAGE